MPLTKEVELEPAARTFEHPLILGGPPNYLGPKGVDAWNRIIQELGATGILHPADREMLAAYCSIVEIYSEAQAVLRRDGLLLKEPVRNSRGDVQRYRLVRHPAVSIVRDQLNLMRSFGALFGLDPKSRKRLERMRRRPPM